MLSCRPTRPGREDTLQSGAQGHERACAWAPSEVAAALEVASKTEVEAPGGSGVRGPGVRSLGNRQNPQACAQPCHRLPGAKQVPRRPLVQPLPRAVGPGREGAMVRRAHEDAACPVHTARPAWAWAWFGCRPGWLGESSSSGGCGRSGLGPLLRQTGGPRGELKSRVLGRLAAAALLSGSRAFLACWWRRSQDWPWGQRPAACPPGGVNTA